MDCEMELFFTQNTEDMDMESLFAPTRSQATSESERDTSGMYFILQSIVQSVKNWWVSIQGSAVLEIKLMFLMGAATVVFFWWG